MREREARLRYRVDGALRHEARENLEWTLRMSGSRLGSPLLSAAIRGPRSAVACSLLASDRVEGEVCSDLDLAPAPGYKRQRRASCRGSSGCRSPMTKQASESSPTRHPLLSSRGSLATGEREAASTGDCRRRRLGRLADSGVASKRLADPRRDPRPLAEDQIGGAKLTIARCVPPDRNRPIRGVGCRGPHDR